MHLPEIKSNNSKLKEDARNLIVNIKLICFIKSMFFMKKSKINFKINSNNSLYFLKIHI